MKLTHKDKSLVKKVALSVFAVGVATSFVLNAEAADVLEVHGDTVTKSNVEFSKIFAKGGANVTLNAGTVSGLKESHKDSDDPVDYGMVEADVAVEIRNGETRLEANNVAFIGEINAVEGSYTVINGGSVTAGNYYYDEAHNNKVEQLATEIGAHGGATIELNKVSIKSNLGAFDGGTITVNDSSVNAAYAIYAENGTINLNSNDGSAVYTVGEYGIEAESGGVINIKGGTVNTTYMVANADTTITVSNADTTITVSNADVKATEIIVAYGEKAIITFDGAEKNIYTVEKGFVAVNDGKIYINGGTLADNNLKSKMYGVVTEKGETLNTSARGIVLDKNGVISTMSDQIYANAASATQKESGAIINEGIDFKGGSLVLNDEKFTQSYSDSAQSELKKQGVTKLTMAGELVKEESGEVQEKITVEEASEKYGSDVALDKVTATAEKNLLVGTTASLSDDNNVDGVTVGEHVANGFAVASLEVKKDGDTSVGIVITNDKAVTLGGSAGGSIITVKDSEDKELADAAVKVVVGTTSAVTDGAATKGTLTIGNSLATAATEYSLKGEVVVNKDSSLVVNANTNVSDAVTLSEGTVAVNNGATLETAKVNVTGNSAITGAVVAAASETDSSAGTLTIDTTGDSNGLGVVLAVGNKAAAGTVVVKETKLNGGMVFLDPVWKDNDKIGDASGFAINSDEAITLDGAYVVGQNSKLALGSDLAAADEAFNRAGETWGKDDISAAAYIKGNVALSGEGNKWGSITVAGSLENSPAETPAGNSLTFAANSLLMVDGASVKQAGDTSSATDYAIQGVKTISVDETSKLYIDGAEKGATYNIAEGAINGDNESYWQDSNIISNNSLLVFIGKESQITDDSNEIAKGYDVTSKLQSVKDAYDGAVITPDAYDAALNNDKSAAGKFAWNAADNKVNAGKGVQVSALNSAAAMTELAGVEHGTYAASNLMTDAVSDHLSLANDRTHDSDIWAKYIHTKEDIDGLDIAGAGASYDAQFNGVVVGADLYHGDKATVGVALSYVDGNINGRTLAASTKNDATYYGASIYGGIQNADSAIVGDISYLHGKNDITQYNSGASLTADAKSDAFSIGVRAEKSFAAGVGKFVPYAGLRYMHLGTGNYTNSIGMAYDGDDLNLWLLPVGVKYSANVAAGGWTIRPIAEVGYVWNLGDTDAVQTVSISGTGNSFSYDVTDSGSYIARLALEAEKADVTYGLAYEYQKGDSVKANRFTANVNWSF